MTSGERTSQKQRTTLRPFRARKALLPDRGGSNYLVRSLLESHDASHNVAAVVLLPGSCLLRRFVHKHVHLVFPDLLGREALAHRPAQGEEREIAFGHGTTVREQLWVIQPVVQIQRIERRRDWHAVDAGNIRAKLLPIEILDMGDRVSPPWLFPVHFEHVGGEFAGLVVDSVSKSWTLR